MAALSIHISGPIRKPQGALLRKISRAFFLEGTREFMSSVIKKNNLLTQDNLHDVYSERVIMSKQQNRYSTNNSLQIWLGLLLTNSVALELKGSSPRSQQTLPPFPNLSQLNPRHTRPANLPKIHSDPILPSTPRSSEWTFFPSRFLTKTLDKV
jgi:hypothetical protein